MRPRGRWKRKLRDSTGRPAARRLAASGSPSTPTYSRPSNENRTMLGLSPAPSRGRRRAATSANVERRRTVDADPLRLEEAVEALHAELASDPALLHAAERALRQPDVVRVDPHV